MLKGKEKNREWKKKGNKEGWKRTWARPILVDNHLTSVAPIERQTQWRENRVKEKIEEDYEKWKITRQCLEDVTRNWLWIFLQFFDWFSRSMNRRRIGLIDMQVGREMISRRKHRRIGSFKSNDQLGQANTRRVNLEFVVQESQIENKWEPKRHFICRECAFPQSIESIELIRFFHDKTQGLARNETDRKKVSHLIRKLIFRHRIQTICPPGRSRFMWI